MRSKDRIHDIVQELESFWVLHPDLRLGQVISILTPPLPAPDLPAPEVMSQAPVAVAKQLTHLAATMINVRDPFHVEDTDMLHGLKSRRPDHVEVWDGETLFTCITNPTPAKILALPTCTYKISPKLSCSMCNDKKEKQKSKKQIRLEREVGTSISHLNQRMEVILDDPANNIDPELVELARKALDRPPSPRPLPLASRAVLEKLKLGPIPRSQINHGVIDLLIREDLAEFVDLPSPFKTHKGKPILHLRLRTASPDPS